MIKAIFMDFAGVISEYGNLVNELEPFFKIPKEEMREKYNQAKVGLISNEEYISQFTKEGFEKYKAHVLPHEGIYEFLKSNNQPIYIASNHVSQLVQEQIDMLNVRNFFKEIFISNVIKSAKPDKKFFEYILEKTNLNANEVVFVDDQKKNLTTPKEIGMKTIWINNTHLHDFGNNNPIIPDAEVYDLSKLNEIIKGFL